MTETDKEELALFRYGVISELGAIRRENTSLESRYLEPSSQTYVLPDGSLKQFKASTIKKWHLAYKGGGLAALKPKQRIDLGSTRALTPELCATIDRYLTKFPKITGQKVWEKLWQEGHMKKGDASVDTVQRYLKRTRGCVSPDSQEKEHLAFEFSHVNDAWQTDTVDTVYITTDDGQRRETHLISIHDDFSRMNVGGDLYFEDNQVNMQKTLKAAVMTYGIPRMLILDNGSAYRNRQMKRICAELGIHAVYLAPYSPEGKGKEERSHRTALERLFNCTDFSGCHDLESLNRIYHEYVAGDYNVRVNRMTNTSPRDRFMSEYGNLRFMDRKKIDFIFLHSDERTLYNNSTIQFNNRIYEVPQEYIVTMASRKDKIPVRFDPEDLSELYIVNADAYEILYRLKPVDLAANAKRKRHQLIEYGAGEGNPGGE